MPVNRFKMSFNNLGVNSVSNYNNNNLAAYMSSAPSVNQKAVGLNSPMIDRVYKARPGCSACGKKVA